MLVFKKSFCAAKLKFIFNFIILVKMYTEINEAVNFIARHMHFRIPRLKVCSKFTKLENFSLLLGCLKMDFWLAIAFLILKGF